MTIATSVSVWEGAICVCVYYFGKGVRVAGKAAHCDTNLVKNVRSQDEKIIENSNCCVASFPPKMIFHVEGFGAFKIVSTSTTAPVITISPLLVLWLYTTNNLPKNLL